MPLIRWNKNYSVEVEEFDNQHQKLIDIINSLHDAMKQGQAAGQLNTILKELAFYTKTHFASEEKLMIQKHFPGYLAHKKEHQELMRQVEEYRAAVDKGEKFISMELLSFLKDWLINHIQGTDKEYSSFLNQN